MARGAGYGQGLLAGMKYVSENKRNEVLNDADRQKMSQEAQLFPGQMQNQALTTTGLTLENVQRQIDNKVKQNVLEREEYENNLIKNMQDGTAVATGQQTLAQGDNQLAQQNRAMGTALSKTDPIRAKKYFDAADGYESAASNKIKTSLEIKAKQADQAGQILANIGNQDELNESLAPLSAIGVIIPPEMRDWKNPKTRDWITRQALRSPTISKDLQDQVGFLQTQDSLSVDKQKNEVVDEQNYNMSLRERASQISANQKATGGGKQSAINERFNDRVINAGSLATASIHNIAQLPLEHTSLGGFKTEKHGIFEATKDMLANKLTDSDNRTYDTLMAGIERNLATLETFGIAPPVSFAKSFERLKAAPGDDVKNRLIKLAEMRQIVETSLSGFKDKPNIPKEQKKAIQEMIDKTATAVPYSVEDVLALDAKKMGSDYTLGNQIRKEGLSKTEERAKQFKVLRD